MGISAVAEGVETREQAAALTMIGCPVGQGFYFSRPLRARDFSELVADHFARTAGPTEPLRIDTSVTTPPRDSSSAACRAS